MKQSKRIVSTVLALAVILSAAACAKEESAADILKKASEKTAAVTSMEAAMDMQMGFDMKMGEETQSSDITATANIVSFSDPVQMKMDMTMNMDISGQSQEMDMAMYAVQEEGGLVMYTNMSGVWQKQTVMQEELMESFKQYDAKGNLNIYFENADSFKEVTTEQINGAEVYRLQGTLSGESLKKAIEESGALSQMGQMTGLGQGQEAYEKMFDNLGDMPVTIWVDKKEYVPVRYEEDMTAVMQAIMKNMFENEAMGQMLPEGFEMNCTSFKITMDILYYNNAEPITVPQEALDATAA